MSDSIQRRVAFPLDDEGYLRRECPYCRREFKIFKADFESLDDKQDYWCPYCGQVGSGDQWWTREQLALIEKITTNIANEIINEQLIRPLQLLGSQSSMINVTSHELECENELINPEINDMKLVSLPCCSKSTKIEENWKVSFHCYYCGFRHSLRKSGES